jgi:hypothetical protein
MAVAIGEAPTANTEPVLTKQDVPAGLGEKLLTAFDSSDDGAPETQTTDNSSAAGSHPAEATESSVPKEEQAVQEEPATEAETTEESSTTPPSPVLPAAFRRTLKAYEYTDEEIEEGLKTQGDKFVQVAARLHNARSKEIAKYAEEGRRAKQARATPTTPVKPAEDDLAPVDASALKKIYGDNEPLIDQLVTPLNKALAEIKGSRAVIRQYEQQQKQATQEAFAKQVNSFFADDELKDFHDQYGTKYETLTDAQKDERVKVLQMADELMTGATISGRLLSIPEVLLLAHDAISSETKDKTARQKIASQLTKREKGMTLKPAGRAAPTNAKHSSKLNEVVKGGLKKAFG